MSLCLSSSWPQCRDCQRRVMAIIMVVLWCVHFLPAVTTRKELLAERVSASSKLYICSHLSVHTTWDAISLSSCAGICFLVLFVLEGLWFQRLTSQSLWMKMSSCILKRKEREVCSLRYQHQTVPLQIMKAEIKLAVVHKAMRRSSSCRTSQLVQQD